MNSKKIRKCVAFIFFLIIFIVLIGEAAGFLVYSESPLRSDAIVILGGGESERIEKGVDLYKNNFADKVIVTNGNKYNDEPYALWMKRQVIKLGVEEEDVLVEDKAKSTFENALNTKNIALEYQFENIIVVSSNYHMRRVKYTFEKVFENTDIDLNFVKADFNYYNPDKWWRYKNGIIILFQEYIRLLVYGVRYDIF